MRFQMNKKIQYCPHILRKNQKPQQNFTAIKDNKFPKKKNKKKQRTFAELYSKFALKSGVGIVNNKWAGSILYINYEEDNLRWYVCLKLGKNPQILHFRINHKHQTKHKKFYKILLQNLQIKHTKFSQVLTPFFKQEQKEIKKLQGDPKQKQIKTAVVSVSDESDPSRRTSATIELIH